MANFGLYNTNFDILSLSKPRHVVHHRKVNHKFYNIMIFLNLLTIAETFHYMPFLYFLCQSSSFMLPANTPLQGMSNIYTMHKKGSNVVVNYLFEMLMEKQ